MSAAADEINATAPLTITQFPDAYAKHKQAWETDWPGFVQWLDGLPRCRSKDQAQWVKLAEFGDRRTDRGCLRHNANMINICGVEADYDGEQVHPETALGMLEAHNLRAVIVTTYSHTADKPRWRVFAPLSKPHAPEARNRLVAGLNGALGGIQTNESFTQSQGFYVGGPEGGEYKVLHTFGDPEDGIALDEWDDLDEHAIYKGSGEGGNDPGESVDEWKAKVSDGEQINPTACRLVGHYVAKGLDDDDIRALMEARLLNGDAADYRPDRVREYLDGGEFDRQLHGARSKGYAPGPEPDISGITGEGDNALPEVDLSDLATADVPPPRFVIEPIIPVGVVTLLGAHGGTGKSMLGLILSVCAATGAPFLGHHIERTRVVFYSCEDNRDVIRHRIKRICNALSINPADLSDWLTVYDMTALDPALYREGMEKGVRFGMSTGMFHRLSDRCAEIGAGLVIVDNASDAFEANENERARVRGFMRSLSQLARELGAGALLLAHLDKNTAKSASKGAESEGYSGSTAWHNSARSRLYLYPQGQALGLEHQKSNLGPKAETQFLGWRDGVLVPVQDARNEAADGLLQAEQGRAILRLIAEFYERGEYLPTSHHAPGNAYKALSNERGFPAGVHKPEFQNLMRGLERAGHLEREEYTNAYRKTRERWRVTESGLESLEGASSAPS